MPGNIISITAETIATWPTPNYVDPPSRDYMPVFASTWVAAATILVGIRFWVRCRGVGGKLGLDDLFLLLGWLTGLMFTVIAIMTTEVTLAKRQFWNIPPESFPKLALHVWIGEFGYLFGTCMVRISVLLFYQRIVAGTYSRKWKLAVLGAIAFTVAWSLAFILALFLNCEPFQAYWMAFDLEYRKSYTCVDTSVINALSGAFAILADLYAVVLPWVMTWRFQMPQRRKWALNAVFSAGLVVVAACSVRTYWTIQIHRERDVSYAIFNVLLWAQFEFQLGIMAASAPSLRVFYKHYLQPKGDKSEYAENSTDSRPSRPKSPFTFDDETTLALDDSQMGSKQPRENVEQMEGDALPSPHDAGFAADRTWSSDLDLAPTKPHSYQLYDMERGIRRRQSSIACAC